MPHASSGGRETVHSYRPINRARAHDDCLTAVEMTSLSRVWHLCGEFLQISNYRFVPWSPREEVFLFDVVATRRVSFVFLPYSHATLSSASALDAALTGLLPSQIKTQTNCPEGRNRAVG